MEPGTLKAKVARGVFPQWLLETPLWIQLNPCEYRTLCRILMHTVYDTVYYSSWTEVQSCLCIRP
jgi:hypothetical protein